MVRYILGMLLCVFLANSGIAQNCKGFNTYKDKKEGTITASKVVSKKYNYNMLIRKTYKPSDATYTPIYSLFFNSFCRRQFPKEDLKNPVSLTILLADSSSMTLDSVYLKNELFPQASTVGFYTRLTETQIKTLAKKPILGVLDSEYFTQSMTEKFIDKQRQVYECLLLRK